MTLASAPTSKPLWQDVTPPKYTPGKTAWLMTFVDLTGLMVVFFVLLFSKQTLESETWEIISGSFKAKFAPREAVVQAVADGVNNASVRYVPTRSGLGYLDALMQQRLEKSPVWSGLRGQEQDGMLGREMVYEISADQKTEADWVALGHALRGWKNPVGVRASAAQGALDSAAAAALGRAAVLGDSGVVGAFAEVKVGTPGLYLIVRAQ